MRQTQTAMLHYAAPPVVGGVEAVIQAHARVLVENGYPATVIAGRGAAEALPAGAGFVRIPEVDSLHPVIARASTALAQGQVPPDFAALTARLAGSLGPILCQFDVVIVHNVFTKHFNLPLTAALYRLLDAGDLRHVIAWCHDLTWTSPHSRSLVHQGYPWDLLRTYRPDVSYVAVSRQRQQELATLLGCPVGRVRVVYNGVDPGALLGLSSVGQDLATRLGLWASDLNLLMPVRVTRAKNIEFSLRVMAALKAPDYGPRLVVTGPPDPHDTESMAYFRSLQALRRELGVEAEVRFVAELGPDPAQPFTIEASVVGDLYRVSDVMFMPSHREGFGMPVLEAGLAGLPVVCAASVPAAREIGGADVIAFDAQQDPVQLAERIRTWAERDPVHRLRRRVRQQYTWPAIFGRGIRPLLDRGPRDAM
ncbi:MAG: glycosyltransferase family 4 protein [Chloroflexi bacterium]|nr:glycosyltransferase family 4 protein [Chloroflexota bacterium]MBU1748264.1 glycosyltransferase family 4 protein [Chloroflexota bacterium]